MGLTECLLIAIGVIALIFLTTTIVRRISAYYRQQHNMSIWAGVFLLAIVAVLVVFSVYHYNTLQTSVTIIASIIFIITAFLDIYHAGIGAGVLALLFQIILASVFIAVVLIFIVSFVIRELRHGNDLVLDTVTGTTSGFRNGVRLFFRFFRM